MKILFVPTFTETNQPNSDHSSDAVGYGISSSRALVKALRKTGSQVIETRSLATIVPFSWRSDQLQRISAEMDTSEYDVVFQFHCWWPLSSEVRRLIVEKKSSACLVAYSHGSHWDKTDTFRNEQFGGLKWADLGAILACDRVFLGSEWMQNVLIKSIGDQVPTLTGKLKRIAKVVGVPIDTEAIDQAPPIFGRSNAARLKHIVFNHALIASKRPELFYEQVTKVLDGRRDVHVHFTRGSVNSGNFRDGLIDLITRFGNRVIAHDTLPLDRYYRLLKSCDIQVSTASHESFGISSLEAMYAGCPSLAPNWVVYPEIHGAQSGSLYHPGGSDLCERINHFLDCAESLEQLRSSQIRVAENFCAQNVAQKISHDIGKLLET